jgi:hypothetical protein
MHQVFETYNLPKLTKKEKIVITLTVTEKLEFVIKALSKRKFSIQMALLMKSSYI